MNEREIELTKDLIKNTKEDHTPIPNKLLFMHLKDEEVGFALECICKAFKNVKKDIEEGWWFVLQAPINRGNSTYSLEKINGICTELLNQQVLSDVDVDGDNISARFNIEFLFLEDNNE